MTLRCPECGMEYDHDERAARPAYRDDPEFFRLMFLGCVPAHHTDGAPLLCDGTNGTPIAGGDDDERHE